MVDVYKDGGGNIVSLFADHSEGIRVAPSFFSTIADQKPETSQQIEGGVKLALASGLSGTLAVFEITRQNVTTADPARPFFSIQTGEQRSRGFEADLVWQPDAQWQFLASYAHVDAVVAKDNTLPIGALLQYVPPDSGRLWANYRFDGVLRGVSIGTGLYAVSRTPLTSDNRFSTPALVTVDAKISYEIADWTLAIVGKNLTDRIGFQPYPFLSGYVRPSDERSVYATASVKF